MLTIVSSFCVVVCFVSCIYSAIIFYHFRSAKRMAWFAGLCLAFGINILAGLNFSPLYIRSVELYVGIYCNIFLASQALVTMCLHIYSEFLGSESHSKFHDIFNYICFLIAAFCMIVPAKLCFLMYIIVNIASLFAYGYAFYLMVKKVMSGDKYFLYPAVAYFLFIACTFTEYFYLRNNKDVVNPAVLCTPLFLILHIIMMLRQHSLSVAKTKKLSASLADTIERINHSDTALMCTQMKADFLYKSLDLISQKCDEDPYTAEDLTVSLSKYLRHTLNFQQLKGIVPLQNEIELTKSFIAIEKERYPKLSFDYRFPNPLPDFYIPPLSIQPLVENAIDHGFDGTEENPKITITIIPYRDYYHIDVSDNGKGMDEETVNALTDTLCDSARIGIYNIHTRLINLFGKGLVIQSAPGVGSSVSFVVPPNAQAMYNEMEGKEK